MNTVIVTLKSEKETEARKGRLTLGCERAEFYRDNRKSQDQSDNEKKKRMRDTATKKCGCPFMLKGVPLGGDRWKLEVVCGEHNHVIPNTLVGHSFAGRLKEDEKKIVKDLSLCGVKPKQILATLKQRDPDNLATMKTIYNVKAYLRLRDLEGRSIVQQLMKMLDEKHYVHYCRSDPNTDEIMDIFWAHPDSILLARCFPSVVMVDCTYKTNRYQLPLLQIVGTTSTSKTFCIALALLYKERENNYEWAYTHLKNLFDPNALPSVFVSDREQASMNAIEKVFPDARLLLCTFHISKKVEQHCKPTCNTKEEWTNFIQGWHDVMQAECEKDFFDRWEAFKQNCPLKFAKCLNYLATTWLIHKEKFVLAWTNEVKHRGNRTTNRAEGAHAKLKRWIGSSQGTFTTLWEALDNLIKVEIDEVKADFEQSMMKVRHFHKFSQFKELRSHVSHFALTKIVEEMARIQYVRVDIHACGHAARTVYGILCAHEIMHYERE